jgi:hypothetical protein
VFFRDVAGHPGPLASSDKMGEWLHPESVMMIKRMITIINSIVSNYVSGLYYRHKKALHR